MAEDSRVVGREVFGGTGFQPVRSWRKSSKKDDGLEARPT